METDTYGIAWKILKDRIARSRRQSISKVDLTDWQLQALEAAVDRLRFEEARRGQQEET